MATIDEKDAPYKANILTDNKDKKVKVGIKEIATLCIDVQKNQNVKKETEIDPNNSALFKSLGY